MPRTSGQQRKPYKGLLAKPIKISKPLPSEPTILGDGVSAEAKKEHAKARYLELLKTMEYVGSEREKRLQALMEHYKIPSDKSASFGSLARELATDHVKGFKIVIEKESGRQLTWNEFVLAKLYFDVQNKLSDPKLNISAACHDLLPEKPWVNMLSNGRKLTAKTLQNRYTEAQKTELIQCYLRIQSDGRLKDCTEDFESMVNKVCEDMYFQN